MRKTTLLATTTLAALVLTLLSGAPRGAADPGRGASAPAAAAPEVTCRTWLDFEVDNMWGGRVVENDSIRSEGRSQEVDFRRRTSALIGEFGSDDSYSSDHLVVTDDGRLLEVRQTHQVGSRKFTVKTLSVPKSDFEPYRFGGQFGSFFTISEQGTVHLHEMVGTGDPIKLKEPRELPVKLPNPGGVAVWRMDDQILLYSNNRESGTLRLVVMPEGKPAQAKGHVIASSGWRTPTHLAAGPCFTPDRTANRVALLAVNENSGNASLRAHYDPLAHTRTLVDARQVGKGTWRLDGLGQ